jgi:hypothetical protein
MHYKRLSVRSTRRADVLATNVILANSNDSVGRDVASAQTRVKLFESGAVNAESREQSHCGPVSSGL